MQQLYAIFYKNLGVRRIQNLVSPRLLTLDSLPRSSMVHFLSEDAEQPDIDVSQLYLAGYSKKIVVDYAEVLTGELGKPARNSVPVRSLTRPFHASNKKFIYQKDAAQINKDDMTLVMCNYSYLDKLYRYAVMPMTAYNRWWNTQKTMFDTIGEIAKTSARNHFVFVDAPKDLPSFGFLKTYSRLTNLSMLKIFDTPDKLFVLELWKWLDLETRAQSIFASLPENEYGSVNVVFRTDDGRSAVLNLAYIDSWINGSHSETEFKSVTKFASGQVQKLFLKFLMVLQSAASEEIAVDADPAAAAEPMAATTTVDEMELDNDAEMDADEWDEPSVNITSGKSKEVKSAELREDIDLTKDLGTVDMDKHMADIDEEINALDVITKKKLKDQGIHIDKTGEVVELPGVEEVEVPRETIVADVYGYKSANDTLTAQVSDFADFGLLTASEYKKFNADIASRQAMKDPYGSNETAVQAMVVNVEDLALNAEKTTIEASEMVLDKTMLQSSLLSMDYDYLNKVMKKDLLSMVNDIQKAGVVIKKHEIDFDHSALGSYENHTLELKPIDGQPSTLRFRIPKVDTDGTFIANGNKYVMRKQRVDLPIRKINPSSVALTSYYGKTFVTLSQKKANNSVEWIVKQLNKAGMEEHTYLTKVAPAMVFDNNFKAPFIYNALASHFKIVKAGRFNLVFDHTDRKRIVTDEDVLATMEKGGARVIGYTDQKEVIVVDKDDIFKTVSKGKETTIGTIYDVLELSELLAPVDFTEVRVFSKTIPVATILGYFIGLKNLIKLLNVQYRFVEGRKNKNLENHEYALTFKDGSYVFSRRDRVASLILAGFLEYEKAIKTYDFAAFNEKDVYLNLLTTKGLGSLYIREMELTQQLFVDPVTKGVLEEMKEPLTFNGLLIRSTEMLETYHHPDGQDTSVMRVRGYERITGAIYKELTVAIRQYKNKNIAGKSKIDMSPYQISSAIMKDPAIKIVEDINPIQNLKEAEVVTYAGEGGRSKDSMNKASRAYHPNDMGIVSEATVDSSDVGVNAYLSANPQFKNLRGMVKKPEGISPTSLISTSALLAPAASHDTVKRVNFISVQQSHTIAADGYTQPQYRTGYEYVMANRTTDMFAYTAKKEGKVTAITETGIIVEYTDGEIKGVTLGRIFGKAEGSVYPHDIVTPMKVGQKFKKGDAVAYNTGFFEPDTLDPKRIIMKNSMTVKVALYESNQTHEDSSAISKALSVRMKAKTTKVKSYVVNFNQNLLDVVKTGQRVTPKDILMIIEDEITSTSNVFDEQSLAVLKKLSNQAPKANYVGVVDKIEILYHGDKSDMTPSLKALADRSDKHMVDTCKSSGRPVITGQVNDDYRVGGVPLTVDKAEIKFYITIETMAGVGDKSVMASQMKSVIGEVMDYDMHTKTGEKIDMVFGFRSVMARVCYSPMIMGTTITLLNVIAKKAVQIYGKTK